MVTPLSMGLRLRIAAALTDGETVYAATRRFGAVVTSVGRALGSFLARSAVMGGSAG